MRLKSLKCTKKSYNLAISNNFPPPNPLESPLYYQ